MGNFALHLLIKYYLSKIWKIAVIEQSFEELKKSPKILKKFQVIMLTIKNNDFYFIYWNEKWFLSRDAVIAWRQLFKKNFNSKTCRY